MSAHTPAPDNTPTPASRLVAGDRVFHRYLLKRLVGRGGMGVVWLARDEKLQQEVALKFLSDEMLHDPNAVERLKRETRHSLQLTHPNIIRIHDFVEDANLAAIAMEFVDGWSLWAMKVDRPQQRFTLEEIHPWVRQLCTALEYAHENVRLVHRDLKPSNLLIDARNQLKISDFGIAWSLTSSGNDTTTHPVLGTVGYMSPQQAKGEEPCIADDIYSLGATIYELLSGTPPFYKGEILAQVFQLTPPSMAERLLERGIEDVSIPWNWEDVVAACLEKNVVKRPRSVKEVWRRLENPMASPRRVEVKPKEIPPPKPPTSKVEVEVEQPAAATKPEANRIWPTKKILVGGGIVFAIAASAYIGWNWGTPLMQKLKAASLRIASSVKSSANEQAVPAGSLDLSFDPGTGTPEEIRCLAIQSDGKILIGGPFRSYDGDETRFGVTRLNPDGEADSAFVGNAQGTVHAISVQSNGQIIIGGDFGFVRHTQCKTVARLNADGSLDAGFDPGAGGNKEVRCVLSLPDGKILVGGSFTSFNGVSRSRLVRLNSDGSVDPEFDLKFSDIIWTLVPDLNGDVLLGGNFLHGSQVRVMRRLEGALKNDQTFKTPNGPNDTVYSLAVQKDGKILVGGKFGRVGGFARNSLARLNDDGSVDSSFNAPIGDASVQTIALQNDGKVLIGGTFTNIGDVLCNRVARLNSDGSLDTNFHIGTGPNLHLRSLALQPDGKIVIVGGFSEVNGVKRPRIARLFGTPVKVSIPAAPVASDSDVEKRPLKLFWNGKDNFSTATDEGVRSAVQYSLARVEGHVLAEPVAGTVPLKLYWNGKRKDNLTAATETMERDALAAGYTFVRIEGYVFPDERPGTVPLKLFYSDKIGDHFTTATEEGEHTLTLRSDYRFVRIEGYVYPADSESEMEEILFDGSSTDAWRRESDLNFPSGSWVAKNGVLASVPVEKNNRENLMTKDSFADFELELEWRIMTGGGNSGVFYRFSIDAPSPLGGPEYQIVDENSREGGIPNRSTGSVYDILTPQNKFVKPLQQFNETRIVAKGNHIEHWLNGVKILEYDSNSGEVKKAIAGSRFKDRKGYMQERTGHIILQNHTGEVQFRNIRIRKI